MKELFHSSIESDYQVVPHPDPDKKFLCSGSCESIYVVMHQDGSFIEWYHGKRMSRQVAEILKSELELSKS